jgi:hypothetical protein
MTDDRRTDGTTPGVFDDDRLLALALSLDDDPELIAAAAADDALGRRLEAMRAEVAGITAQVRAAVPPPDEAYADPADPRWAELHGFFAPEAPRTARERGRASRWLRVLAPAAAVIVALAVGIAVLEQHGGGTVSSQSNKAAGEATAPLASGRATDGSPSLADEVDEFALVVLARARAAQGAVQRFAVVRVLKGKAPDVLRLHIADGAAPAGRLQLLLLRPLATVSGEAQIAVPSPAPAPATSSILDDYGAGQPIAYSYQGQPAMARELPAGTDPNTVTLP